MANVSLKVSGIHFLYADEDLKNVEISFYSNDPLGDIYVNGLVSIEPTDYFSVNGLEALASLAKEKFIARLEEPMKEVG